MAHDVLRFVVASASATDLRRSGNAAAPIEPMSGTLELPHGVARSRAVPLDRMD
ncbi:hypothetical protein [Aureimonas jatrophae]|uniref:hypothetical protein n=1 Tax=Aureimonas jatrophae TaxID=1166073 RepID=UPI0014808914|nr:hypothetical protein [Aureimonas jatrophae]MBB3952704.1 hypothetical protein [Aureimonas jatrophae]